MQVESWSLNTVQVCSCKENPDHSTQCKSVHASRILYKIHGCAGWILEPCRNIESVEWINLFLLRIRKYYKAENVFRFFQFLWVKVVDILFTAWFMIGINDYRLVEFVKFAKPLNQVFHVKGLCCILDLTSNSLRSGNRLVLCCSIMCLYFH